jgi:hypothetical protein
MIPVSDDSPICQLAFSQLRRLCSWQQPRVRRDLSNYTPTIHRRKKNTVRFTTTLQKLAHIRPKSHQENVTSRCPPHSIQANYKRVEQPTSAGCTLQDGR